MLGNETQTENTTPFYKGLMLAEANVTQYGKYYLKVEFKNFENTVAHLGTYTFKCTYTKRHTYIHWKGLTSTRFIFLFLLS